MSTLNILYLDWRDAPKTAEIVDKIHRLLYQIDAGGIVHLRLEHTTAANVANLEEDDGVTMLRRRDHTSPRDAKKRADYWFRLLQTATMLHDMVVTRQNLKIRFIQYREALHHEDLAVIKKKVIDVALTLKIHPAAFGIEQQAGGIISIPKGVTLENTLVSDIFQWEDRQRSEKQKAAKSVAGTEQKRLRGTDVVIPALVLEVKVKLESHARIDAVIVTEHRNLSTFGIDNVLIVMTGGFPSTATKEYLHLLSNHNRLKDLPFLCFVDHDMGGFTIFQTLKYGSKMAAWASKAMVCPQLQYAGPTRQDLKDSARLYRPHWVAQFQVTHPDTNDEDVQTAADKWVRRANTKVGRKFSQRTAKDMEIYRSFQKLGWLDLEPKAKMEVDWIARTEKGSKFRIAALSTVSLDYPRLFLETKLTQRCKNRGTVKAPPPVTPAGARLQNTPSQFSSVLLGTEHAASQANMEMLDFDTVEPTALHGQTEPSSAVERRLTEMDVP